MSTRLGGRTSVVSVGSQDVCVCVGHPTRPPDEESTLTSTGSWTEDGASRARAGWCRESSRKDIVTKTRRGTVAAGLSLLVTGARHACLDNPPEGGKTDEAETRECGRVDQTEGEKFRPRGPGPDDVPEPVDPVGRGGVRGTDEERSALGGGPQIRPRTPRRELKKEESLRNVLTGLRLPHKRPDGTVPGNTGTRGRTNRRKVPVEDHDRRVDGSETLGDTGGTTQ
ncbi:Hypothetical predicted protein [Marmota monax]|uniref:Uncharacterized protein n=1 Tax=Marmota monax TaxID=9995 RepID=A0A5E4AWA0_MARMO|nr:Hypothetical predicted protein [Marmota monax]